MEKVNFKDYDSPFATRLRDLMKERETKRIELAELLGVSRQSIGQYCDGTSLPPADKIVVLADYFDISTDYLLGLTNIPTVDTTVKSICEFIGFDQETVLELHDNKEQFQDNMVGDFYCDLIRTFSTFPDELFAYIISQKRIVEMYDDFFVNKSKHDCSDIDDEMCESFLFFQAIQYRLSCTFNEFINGKEMRNKITALNSHFDYFGINSFLDVFGENEVKNSGKCNKKE